MDPEYDVFVSYRWVEPDQTWVRDSLVPALEAAGLKVCLDVNDFTPGRDLMLEMERAGKSSRNALCVITPNYFQGNRMVGFEALMARRFDPSGAESRLIPLILKETSLPEWIRGLIPIDWTHARNRRREWKKLLKVLSSPNPDTPPPPDADGVPPVSQQATPTTVSQQPEERKKLRFVDDIKSDPVSVRFAVTASHEKSIPYDIAWPAATLQHLTCIKQLRAEAEDYHSSKSRFYGADVKVVNSFAESSRWALASAEKIIATAASRIPKLLEGMNGYWGFLDTPQEHALANYLTWANLRVLQDLVYPLRYEILYDSFFPKQYELWFGSRAGKQSIREVFDIQEPIHSAYCVKVEGRRVSSYYWGPSSQVIDAYRMSAQSKPLTNPWYARFLIPQVELDLAIQNSDQVLVYREQAILSKVVNEDGREIDPSTDQEIS